MTFRPLVAALVAMTAFGHAYAQQAAPVSPFARPTQATPSGLPPGIPLPPIVPPGGVVAPSETSGVTEQHIQGPRIGQVNGLHIYRGTGTYLFEPTADRTVVKKWRAPVEREPAVQGAGAPESAGAERRPNLPSAVGRPAPRN